LNHELIITATGAKNRTFNQISRICHPSLVWGFLGTTSTNFLNRHSQKKPNTGAQEKQQNSNHRSFDDFSHLVCDQSNSRPDPISTPLPCRAEFCPWACFPAPEVLNICRDVFPDNSKLRRSGIVRICRSYGADGLNGMVDYKYGAPTVLGVIAKCT
jgi:hypothetical protein